MDITISRVVNKLVFVHLHMQPILSFFFPKAIIIWFQTLVHPHLHPSLQRSQEINGNLGISTATLLTNYHGWSLSSLLPPFLLFERKRLPCDSDLPAYPCLDFFCWWYNSVLFSPTWSSALFLPSWKLSVLRTKLVHLFILSSSPLPWC